MLADELFRSGDYTTAFISPKFLSSLQEQRYPEVAAMAAAIAQFEVDHQPVTEAPAATASRWRERSWR